MVQTRKNGRQAVGKRGNSGRRVTLKKSKRCIGGGVKKIARKHSVKRKKKSSGGKKTVKRAQCGSGLNTFYRQFNSKRNTEVGGLTKFNTLGWQVGRTMGQYVTRGTFPDLNYTNNLVRAIALRVGLTPEMIEVFGARAKSGVPKTIFKMRNKNSDLFDKFINLGTLQEIPDDVSQQSANLSTEAEINAAEAQAEEERKAREEEAATAEQATATAEQATATAEQATATAAGVRVEGVGPDSSVGGGIKRKIIDTILKPYRGLMRQAAVDLVNTNNLVRLIAYQLGMTPVMISEIAGYHNDPEGKHGFPKTYYKDKNKVFRDLFNKLPRVTDGKASINIPDDALDLTDSVTNISG